LKMLYGSMHAKDGVAYFARAVIYAHKMFMKCTTGINVVKMFFFIIRLYLNRSTATVI
jgi:hypothetical protein